jgi:hypothetical protein
MLVTEIHMSLTQLRALMVDAGEVAAKKALTDAGLIRPTITRHKAAQLHGKSTVERWITEGLLHPQRDGVGLNWRIDCHELESVVKASNRHSFLKTT